MKFNVKTIILSLIIILIVSFLIIFFGKKHDDGGYTDNPIIYQEVNLTPDNIMELLSYIPFSIVNFSNYKNAYYGNNMSIEQTLPIIIYTLFNDEKFNRFTVKNIEEEDLKKILEDNKNDAYYFLRTDVDEFLTKSYNQKITLLNTFNDSIKVLDFGEKYMTFSFINYGEYVINVKTMLSLEQTKGDTTGVIFVEKALFTVLKSDKYYVYKNTNVDDEKNVLKVYDKVNEEGKTLDYVDIDAKIKEDFKDYKSSFKHTFKKNDTGYYWYSTEFIE